MREVGCGDAAMAQSRCSFSILIRYGSLKVSSINAFLDCWNRSGMIVAEELLSREWKCFLHGVSGKKTVSLCSGWNAPAVESGSGKKSIFQLSTVVRISHSMEMPG